MQTLIEGLRQIVGTAQFYDVATGAWDYAAMCEYMACVVILLVVVASVFRLLGKAVSR